MLNLNLDKEFINKKVIVTGSSQGLGAETCKALALRGARIAMFSRSKIKMDKLKKTMKNSSGHISIQVDLLNSKSLNLAVKKAKKFLKEIDIIIHVAGGGYGLKDSLIKSSDLNTLFQVNLGAAVEINKHVVEQKKKKKDLKLIHVGSIASNEAVGSVGYNVVKSALAAYVRSLGRELSHNKVLVTGILPGGFIAKNNAMDRLKKKNAEIYKKFIKNRLPRGVMGKAEEVIPMLLFLCSKHSKMMGGCLIPMDAGEGRSYQI